MFPSKNFQTKTNSESINIDDKETFNDEYSISGMTRSSSCRNISKSIKTDISIAHIR